MPVTQDACWAGYGRSREPSDPVRRASDHGGRRVRRRSNSPYFGDAVKNRVLSVSGEEGRRRLCELFASGPTPISRLAFVSRTPKRLFSSLAGQTQLTALAVKWGDDLNPVAGMRGLEELWLGGASSVRTLQPLAKLRHLHSLTVEGLRYVHDSGPLAELNSLRSLELGADWISPRTAHIDSIIFLRRLAGLERLVLHSVAADDLDYSPLLDLPRLKELRVARVRGMQPSHEELSEAIPALAAAPS